MKTNKGTRKFLGPLNPREEKIHHTTDLNMRDYCNLQKKHLREYLKGNKQFMYKGILYQVEEDVKE